MKITKNIIDDLLPIYFSNDCSRDTKQLVEEFLKSNPDYAQQFKKMSIDLPTDSLPYEADQTAEMRSLKRIRRLLKWRSFMMGFAIFFSILPFSFAYVNGQMYVFMREAPVSAAIYGLIGIIFWIAYIILRKKSSGI